MVKAASSRCSTEALQQFPIRDSQRVRFRDKLVEVLQENVLRGPVHGGFAHGNESIPLPYNPRRAWFGPLFPKKVWQIGELRRFWLCFSHCKSTVWFDPIT